MVVELSWSTGQLHGGLAARLWGGELGRKSGNTPSPRENRCGFWPASKNEE